MKNSIFNRTVLSILLILFSTGAAVVRAQNAPAPDGTIEGHWLGVLEAGGVKLRLVLKITRAADGSLAARLDSLDQGARDLKIDRIARQNQSISFAAKDLGLNYEGILNERADEIAGKLVQYGATPLVFKRVAGVPTLPRRPQDPPKPRPYDEEEAVYENKKDRVKLAGTLTLPRADGQHPAVILITGSGAQDRDSTVFGHRPFLVLADYLTRRGIAVLRVDDRGVGGSSLGALNATSENFAGDVLAGIEYLKTRKEINPQKIGLVGHSEGGMIAPMVAARSKDVAFVVMLAGMGQTGADTLYTQAALIQKAAGLGADFTALNRMVQKTIFDVLKTEPNNELALQRIKETLARRESEMTAEQKTAFVPIKAAIDEQIQGYLSPWFRYFVAYDPRPALEKVKVPVLAINGENDLQVSATENLGLIEAALKAGGNKNYKIVRLPKLNHLFQTSETGLPGEYEKIEETIAPVALETIGDWIAEQTKKR